MRATRTTILVLILVGGPFLLTAGADQASAPDENKGRFIGIPAFAGNTRADFRLTADFAYIDLQGKRWEAPRGSKHDCASIPRILWSLVGGPCEGNYLRASIIHDVYCELGRIRSPKREPWQKVHRMFYHAMRAGDVSKPYALLLYAAVYKYGPTWDAPRNFWRRLWMRIWRFGGLPPPPPPPYEPTEEDLRQLQEQVNLQNPQTVDDAERAVGKRQ